MNIFCMERPSAAATAAATEDPTSLESRYVFSRRADRARARLFDALRAVNRDVSEECAICLDPLDVRTGACVEVLQVCFRFQHYYLIEPPFQLTDGTTRSVTTRSTGSAFWTTSTPRASRTALR